MNDSKELLKSFANRVAALASTEKTVDLVRLLQHAGLIAAHPAARSDDPDLIGQDVGPSVQTDSHIDRVGIWERKRPSNNFVRRLDLAADWYLWANVGRIGPKQGRRRVVLIGESVARGYLYDPQYNPAKALESIFDSHLGPGKVEVVDLARTNMKLEEMKVLAASSMLLEPDAVIIFAGNNWLGAGFHSTRTSDLAMALREFGVAGIKSVLEQQHREAVTEMIGEIGGMYGARRVPLVWIIPEFNIGDWRDPITNAPYLPNDGNKEWIEHYGTALRALDLDELEKAAYSAQKMVELDGGTTAAPFYMLADCARKKGDAIAVKSCLESARDAILWAPYLKTPRTYSLTRTTLRQELTKYGIQVVDLPKLFSDYLHHELPDRRLFLDYCHLNAEGIQIAMAAAASCLLHALDGSDVPWLSLARKSIPPGNDVQAEAMFLAAVHNAHWHQAAGLVEYFCREALRFNPEIARIMECFVEVQMRRSPMLMSQAAEQLGDPRFPCVQRYLLRFNIHQLDKVLVEAMIAAMKERGKDMQKHLDSLRASEQSVLSSKVDLLDPYYITSARQKFAQQQPEEMKIAASCGDYFKAYSPESGFLFVGEAGHPVTLCLSCRLPTLGPAQGRISVEVNGELQAEAAVSRIWRAWDIHVPAQSIKTGLNEVIVRWGTFDFQGTQGLEVAADQMLAGLFPDLYPIFGEIHSFTVAVAADMPQTEANVRAFSLAS